MNIRHLNMEPSVRLYSGCVQILVKLFSRFNNYNAIVGHFLQSIEIRVSVIEIQTIYKARSYLLCKQISGEVFAYILNVEKKIPGLDRKRIYHLSLKRINSLKNQLEKYRLPVL